MENALSERKNMLEFVHHVAYVVQDMEDGIRVFRDLFGLELFERKTVQGKHSFEMASFRCGPTIIELQRPIDYPALQKRLDDHGPGLNHVAYGVRDLPDRIAELESRGVFLKDPGIFLAGTGWNIANIDLEKTDIPFFKSEYHDDHLADAGAET